MSTRTITKVRLVATAKPQAMIARRTETLHIALPPPHAVARRRVVRLGKSVEIHPRGRVAFRTER